MQMTKWPLHTGIIEAPLFLSHAIDSMWDGREVLNDILDEGADSIISAEMPHTRQQMQDFLVFLNSLILAVSSKVL